MRELETRYQRASGLVSRSDYKVFYTPIRPARILTLGINPGGKPSSQLSDGPIPSSSSSYYEHDEHDVIDCDWKENDYLRPLLVQLCGGKPERVRKEVVKTNMAFRRTPRKKNLIENANAESAPFLAEIVEVVRPDLILLTGVAISEFTGRFATGVAETAATVKVAKTHQTVFAAVRAALKRPVIESLIVQVSHASQWGWMYERFDVANRIIGLLKS